MATTSSMNEFPWDNFCTIGAVGFVARKCEFLLKSLMCKCYLSKMLKIKDNNKASGYLKTCGGDEDFGKKHGSHFVKFIRYCMGTLNDLNEFKAIVDYDPLFYHIKGCAKELETSEVLSDDQKKKIKEVGKAERVRCIEIIRELIEVNGNDGENNGIDLVRKLMVDVWLGVLGSRLTLGQCSQKVFTGKKGGEELEFNKENAEICEWLLNSLESKCKLLREEAESKLKRAFRLLVQIADDRNDTLHYTSKRDSVKMDELRQIFEWIVRESGLLDAYNHKLYPAEVSNFYL